MLHRLQVQGIYSTLCTGGTGLGNMSWCQYPVPSISTAGLLHAWLIHSDNICTHSCFYTTLAQNCEILNRILNSILWGRKHHWFSFREAASFLCRFSFNLRYILVWSLYRTEHRTASSLQQRDESPSVNTAEYYQQHYLQLQRWLGPCACAGQLQRGDGDKWRHRGCVVYYCTMCS